MQYLVRSHSTGSNKKNIEEQQNSRCTRRQAKTPVPLGTTLKMLAKLHLNLRRVINDDKYFVSFVIGVPNHQYSIIL